MEEMNEKFEQPFGSQSQPGPSPQPEQRPSGQQNSLTQTFLNIKLSTWIKCFVISLILSVVAVFVAPELTTATPKTTQPSQQQTMNSYSEVDMYDYSQYEDGWEDYECQGDYEYYTDEYEDNWYDDYGYDGYESVEDLESGWYDDYETVDDNSYYTFDYESEDYEDYDYDTEENWYDDYDSEENWYDEYEYEEDYSTDYYGSEEDQWYDDEESWYDDSEENWYDDYEYQEDIPDYYYDD